MSILIFGPKLEKVAEAEAPHETCTIVLTFVIILSSLHNCSKVSKNNKLIQSSYLS